MDNEREKREPTDAEKALFDRIVDGMLYKGGVIEELSVPKAAFRTWCLAVIMQYTDWLRPEPTADDREAAEKIANEWTDTCPSMLAAEIAAALSAARGNRAELEAAAREAREYLDRISDEWENSPTDTLFNHSWAHEAYCISEKIAALLEVKA